MDPYQARIPKCLSLRKPLMVSRSYSYTLPTSGFSTLTYSLPTRTKKLIVEHEDHLPVTIRTFWLGGTDRMHNRDKWLVCYDVGMKHVLEISRCLDRQLQRTTKLGAHGCFLGYCRSLHLVMDGEIPDERLAALIPVVFACTGLVKVDIAFHCPMEPPQTLLLCYSLVARHINTLVLPDRMVRFHQTTLSSRSPGVLNHNFNLHYLYSVLTELKLVHKNGEFLPTQFWVLSQFSSLRSLTFTLHPRVAERHLQTFTSVQSRSFWNAIELLPLETLKWTVPVPVITWDNQIASLPKSLKRVDITFLKPDRLGRTVKIMAILRQLPLLEHLRIRGWRDDVLDQDAAGQPVYPKPRPLEAESLPCHRLKSLTLDSYSDPEFSLQAIVHHCPLLYRVEMPADARDEDILLVARGCECLEYITVNYF